MEVCATAARTTTVGRRPCPFRGHKCLVCLRPLFEERVVFGSGSSQTAGRKVTPGKHIFVFPLNPYVILVMALCSARLKLYALITQTAAAVFIQLSGLIANQGAAFP